MSETARRIITGSILAAAAILGIFFASSIFIIAITALLASGAMWEWCQLPRSGQSLFRTALYCAAAFLLTASMAFGYQSYPFAVVVVAAGWIAGLTWVGWISLTGKGFQLNPMPALGLVVLCPALGSISFLREYSPEGAFLLLAMCMLVWGSDIGAYFVGRKWGSRKLAPLVSPGKTWEGLLGGLVIGTGACFLMLTWATPFRHSSVLLFAGLILCAIVSVLGDLFESALKRSTGRKDSGALLPGHGGLLDRLDSLLAASPVFSGLILLLDPTQGVS